MTRVVPKDMRNTVTVHRRFRHEPAAKDLGRASGKATVRVLVVDDHEPLRRALCEVAAATSEFTVVGEAASGEEALLAVEALRPDLVLMDVRMPGIGGRQATKILVDGHPEVVVWLITAQGPGALPNLAAVCGAAGVVDKRDVTPRLLRELWESGGPPEVEAQAR